MLLTDHNLLTQSLTLIVAALKKQDYLVHTKLKPLINIRFKVRLVY